MCIADRSIFKRLRQPSVNATRLAQDGAMLDHETLPLRFPLFTMPLLCRFDC